MSIGVGQNMPIKSTCPHQDFWLYGAIDRQVDQILDSVILFDKLGDLRVFYRDINCQKTRMIVPIIKASNMGNLKYLPQFPIFKGQIVYAVIAYYIYWCNVYKNPIESFKKGNFCYTLEISILKLDFNLNQLFWQSKNTGQKI